MFKFAVRNLTTCTSTYLTCRGLSMPMMPSGLTAPSFRHHRSPRIVLITYPPLLVY